MAQPESRRSREIQQLLRAQGWFCFKVHGNEHVMAGLPDIICCAEGFFYGIETKEPGREGNTSGRQRYVHTKIIDAGGLAFVASSKERVVEIIKADILKRRRKLRAGD